MVKCAVETCKNDTRKHTKQNCHITFHRFPKEPKAMKKWIDAIRRPNWEPNIWSQVCSLHFSDSLMYETKSGLRRLVQDAVPSLFLQQSPSSDNELDMEVSTSASQSVSGRISDEMSVVYASDVTDTPGNRKLIKEIIRLKDIAKRRRLRCNALYATCKRLKKKVESLSKMLKLKFSSSSSSTLCN